MQLPVQDFATLVKTQAAAIASSSAQLIDTSVGSVLRAILEANASVGLWVQWLILQALSLTRAATSSAGDLDSWVADFGMSRLPAAPAGGQVQLARLTSGLTAIVPVGAAVRTGTSSADQTFTISADPSNPAWNGANGYTVTVNQSSILLPAVASSTGSAGNVLAGAITQLATAIPGIDTVTNPSPMTGGIDAETDDALRARFSLFLDSRARATEDAVGLAIGSVQQGLSYTVASRLDTSGAVRPGHFTVTIDDGTGAPSLALLSQISAAIELVRPLGGTFSVQPPTLTPVDVAALVVGQAAGSTVAQTAVGAYVSSLGIGAALTVSKVIQVIHSADANIQSVRSVTINGAAADFAPTIYGRVALNSISVSSS